MLLVRELKESSITQAYFLAKHNLSVSFAGPSKTYPGKACLILTR